MEAPSLLKIPSRQSIKENDEKPPSLLHIPLDSKKTKSKTIYRLPLQETYKQPKLVNSSIIHSNAPRLLNLKPLLSRYDTTSKLQTVTTDAKTVPKLIRLPHLFIKQHKQLLESPRRSAPSSPKRNNSKPPELPQLVDIRPFSPQQPKQLVKFEEKEISEEIRIVRTPDVPNRSSPSPVPVLLSAKKTKKKTSADSPSDSSPNFSPKHYKKRRKNKQDELYEVITDLLIERKKQRRKVKRIKLFDVVDNLPLTSDEDDSESELELTRKSRIKTKTKPKNQVFSSTGQVFLPKQDISDLPSAPQGTLGKIDVSSYPPKGDIERFKPKLSRFLEPYNKEDDPLSWLNIIRTSRNETKETQTLKSPTAGTNSKQSKHQEIQTELKEMIDIPRSETFFPKTDQEYKQTEEFCARVRNEVLEKLDNKIPLKNKRTQTVVHSHAQTEPLDEFRDDSPVQSKFVSKPQVQPESITATTDPRILSTMSYLSEKPNEHAKQYLDIADVTGSSGLNIGTSTHNNRDPLSVVKFHEGGEKSTFTTDDKQSGATGVDHFRLPGNDHVDLEAKMSPDVRVGSRTDVNKVTEPNDGNKRYKASIRTISPRPTKNLRFKTDRLDITENVHHFAYGVKALEEYHENIERELRASKLLFNTITTLQDGFDHTASSDIQHHAVKRYEENTLKYQIRHHKENDTSLYHEKHLSTDRRFDKPIHNDQNQDHEFDPSLIEKPHEEMLDDRLEDLGTADSFKLDQRKFDMFTEKDNVLSNEHVNFEAVESQDNVSLDPKTPGQSSKYDGVDRTLNSTVRFSHETLLDSLKDEDLEMMLENHLADDMQQRLNEDNKMREEIRKRILKPPTEEEMKSKTDLKREKLRDWMKKKQGEEHTKYRNEVAEKRAKEFQPFKGKESISNREIDRNLTIQNDLKRALLEENNQERMDMAAQLAYDAISPNKHYSPTGRKKFKNNRYSKANKNITPVRETRSSRMRKNALMKDVLNHTARITRSKKPKRKSDATDTTAVKRNRKTTSFGGDTYAFDGPSIDRGDTLGRSFGGRSMDRSFGGRSLDRSFGGLSNRSVEPDDFVTRESYDRYQKKTSKMLKETLRDYKTGKIFEENEDLLETNYVPKPTMTYKPLAAQRRLSTDQINEQSKVNTILQRYGLNNDGKFTERDSSTSNLLADVDAALAYDTDGSTYSQTIDWNEVDKILNE